VEVRVRSVRTAAGLATALVSLVTGSLVGDAVAAGDQPWQTPQCANFGTQSNANVSRGSYQAAASPAGQGARFTLPASARNSACELLHPLVLAPGRDDYLPLMLHVPSGWDIGTRVFWGLALAQLGFVGISGAPLILEAHNDHVTVALATGAYANGKTEYRSNADARGANLPPLYAIPRGQLTRGWHELIIHVRWATATGGVVDVWHRRRGHTAWTRTAHIAGIPTMQWRTLPAPTSAVDKIGAYRGPSKLPVTVVLAGFSIQASFQNAAASFQAGGSQPRLPSSR
jgi:hypothetical protein